MEALDQGQATFVAQVSNEICEAVVLQTKGKTGKNWQATEAAPPE